MCISQKYFSLKHCYRVIWCALKFVIKDMDMGYGRVIGIAEGLCCVHQQNHSYTHKKGNKTDANRTVT